MRLLPWASVRTRLTALYTLLFLACGAALMGVNYALLRATAYEPAGPAVVSSGERTALDPFRQVMDALLGPNQAPGSTDSPEARLRQRERDGALHEMLVRSLYGLGLMTIVSVGLGWAVAGRALRPIHDITAAARRASEHNLRERLGLSGPRDELRELGDTMDALLDRLDGAFEVQRRLAASASRELRAPLAAMRRAIDGALGARPPDAAGFTRMARDVREAVERAERLIDALLVLSRSEEEPRPLEMVDLADAASDAVAATMRESTASGLRLVTSLEPAPAAGVRTLLERAVAELVANAVRHNRPGGAVEVRTGVDDDGAFLIVANDGVAIAPEAVGALFETFHRPAADRAGVGLGLAIARSVAIRHRGGLDAAARAAGGLSVRMVLGGPVATRAPANV
jgi:signal transduction histidine kinase